MIFQESETVELKSIVVDEIKKLDEETNIYKEHDINIHNTEQSYRLSVADPENTYSNSGE